MSAGDSESANHFTNLDQWEDYVVGRYKEGKSESDFRQYDAKANPQIAEFYRINHEKQTVDYVLSKEKQYFGLTRDKKSVWEAAEYLNTLPGRASVADLRGYPQGRPPPLDGAGRIYP